MHTTSEDEIYTQALMRRVEFVRRGVGMTKAQLAHRMKKDPCSIWKWRQGHNVPLAPTEALMAAALAVSRADLTAGEFHVRSDGSCEFVEFAFDRPFKSSWQTPAMPPPRTVRRNPRSSPLTTVVHTKEHRRD